MTFLSRVLLLGEGRSIRDKGRLPRCALLSRSVFSSPGSRPGHTNPQRQIRQRTAQQASLPPAGVFAPCYTHPHVSLVSAQDLAPSILLPPIPTQSHNRRKSRFWPCQQELLPKVSASTSILQFPSPTAQVPLKFPLFSPHPSSVAKSPSRDP